MWRAFWARNEIRRPGTLSDHFINNEKKGKTSERGQSRSFGTTQLLSGRGDKRGHCCAEEPISTRRQHRRRAVLQWEG